VPKGAVFAKWAGGIEARYAPGQPRVPAGSPNGGQWTTGEGGGGGSFVSDIVGGAAGVGAGAARLLDGATGLFDGVADIFAVPNPASNGGDGIAMNIYAGSGTLIDGSVSLAQGRGGGRRFGLWQGEATPSQRDRLETSRMLFEEAIARTQEIDKPWRPVPVLSDPKNIESEIAKNEHLTRQANERYAAHLRQKYGSENFPLGRPLRNLTGPRAPVVQRDDTETQRGRIRENEAADSIWLNGYNVVRLAQRSKAQGVKQPDFRIEAETFDALAPRTNRARNVWDYARKKVQEDQAENLVINLADTSLTVHEIVSQFRTWRIPGPKTILIIDKTLKLHYLIGGI
jgi:hypothetical protein